MSDWRHDAPERPCVECGEPTRSVAPDGRVVHIRCAFDPAEVRRAWARKTPSKHLDATRQLSKILGLPVVDVTRQGPERRGAWIIELADRRSVPLGFDRDVRNAEGLTRVVTDAGANLPAPINPANAGRVPNLLKRAKRRDQ